MTESGQPLAGRRIAEVLATSTGGVGTHLRAILPGLGAAGARLVVAGPSATDELFGFRDAGAAFRPVQIAAGLRPLHDACALRPLRRALMGSELVHAHGLRAGLLSVLSHPKGPLVLTLHNALLTAPGLRQRISAFLERFVIRSVDVVLAASSDLAEHARAVGGTDVRSGPVAAPPLAQASRSRTDVRAEIGVSESAPLLIAIGRLNPQKGYDTLLCAAREWRGRPDGLLVAIAGDGPQHDALAEQIANESLPVLLLGRRSDVPDLLAASDVVLLTSRWEARALVVQEALRAGRPLVATAVGGIPELVGRDAAILIPPDDSSALVEAVAQVLDEPGRSAALVAAGYAAAQQWPSLEDTVRQLSALYAELLGAP